MNEFVFVVCQAGAEKTLKADVASHHPELAFAFSRPGLVTFKVVDPSVFDGTQPIKSFFARTFGHSLGTVTEEGDRISAAVGMLPDKPFRHFHVWKRDSAVPGERQFEPFHLPESLELGQQLRAKVEDGPLGKVAINRTAKQHEFIADFIVVEPDRWLVGWHQATTIATRWPGGVPPVKRPDDMVSRAHLKMQEALRWSRLPIVEGDLCVELGSSPGGSCQCLLERGLRVIGVDPAIMDKRVLSHPNFTHIRARAADLKRKEFADVRWLVSDANIAPENSLAAIEDIVTNRRVNVTGMLITLKLLDWKMASLIPDYLEQIRGWGYRHVRARQLAFNRREVCVVALKNKSKVKYGRRRSKSASSTSPKSASPKSASPKSASPKSASPKSASEDD